MLLKLLDYGLSFIGFMMKYDRLETFICQKNVNLVFSLSSCPWTMNTFFFMFNPASLAIVVNPLTCSVFLFYSH
nr:hypothetical protein BNIPNGOD_00071 [Salmonella enterica subsp. enterica serovar Typhimurium]